MNARMMHDALFLVGQHADYTMVNISESLTENPLRTAWCKAGATRPNDDCGFTFHTVGTTGS